MNIKKFQEHVRECATCNGVGEVNLMCRAGQTLASNISYAGIRSLQEGDAALLKDALAYVKANEWAGRAMVNDELVAVCPDCGAQKGQAHSVNCGCESLLERGKVQT